VFITCTKGATTERTDLWVYRRRSGSSNKRRSLH